MEEQCLSDCETLALGLLKKTEFEVSEHVDIGTVFYTVKKVRNEEKFVVFEDIWRYIKDLNFFLFCIFCYLGGMKFYPLNIFRFFSLSEKYD